MSGTGSLFDPGMQPERTALAWRRTVLALGVGVLVGARLTAHLGILPLVLAGVGAVFVVTLFVATTRRARRVQVALRRDGGLAAGPGGGLAAVVSAAVAAAGVGALLFVLLWSPAG